MNMNKEQVELAVNTGLELLGPKSEIAIPVKLNDGVFLLKQLLVGIAQGQIGLGSTMEDKPKPAPQVAAAVHKAIEDQSPAPIDEAPDQELPND